MNEIHQFIDANMAIVNFFYGLVFFILGLAIALQQRALSNFRLARHLWLLAAFGIIHGTMEWGSVFIPVQSEYVSETWINALVITQKIARAVSFAFLLQFAISMIAPRLPWIPRIKTFVRYYAPLWSLAISVMGIFILPGELGEGWIRYLLAFPAAFLTAAAFFLERKSFAEPTFRAARANLTFTSISFGIYALVGGLVVPEKTLWPLSWFKYETVFAVTSFPIQLYRAVIGLAMAFFIIKTLSLFDIEIRNRVELIERNQALLEDRQRIARDLHDGVIQSIYAAGLQLVAATRKLEPQPVEAAAIIRRVTGQLNSLISDIRSYIFELSPAAADRGNLIEDLKHLLDDCSYCCPIETELIVQGEMVELTPLQKQNLNLITRECLGNIAKHSLASRVESKMDYRTDGLEYSLKDNGIGIEASRN